MRTPRIAALTLAALLPLAGCDGALQARASDRSAAGAEAAHAAPEQPPAPLRFEEFPAEAVYAGAPAEVVLASHPRAQSFRTMLRRGAAAGPNFAGHLTVVTWGCGTQCQEFMVVDAASGRVYPGLTTELGVEHQVGSRLLVVNPPDRVAETRCPDPGCTTRYFVWAGDRLEPLLAPEERDGIVAGARDHVRAQGVDAPVAIEIEAVEGGYARVRVVPESGTLDPAMLYLHEVEGQWRGLAIGTAFPPEALDRMAIPPAVR
jgi:hypothetical protein